MERIPIIDEEGNRIGEEYRSIVHERELLHPAVRVLVRLPDGKFVFQLRSMQKESNAGKLTFTATGHVKSHQSLEEAGVEELFEETGIQAKIEDLVYLGNIKSISGIEGTVSGGKQHRVFGYFFGYSYNGALEDLKPEENEVDGFKAYSLDELNKMSEQERKAFINIVFIPQVKNFFEKYESTISK
ncbi:MAG: NUDIX domain-containing protein [Candidatus Pacebacteria bacterium]|nr:NUDIX domain-containing protein [Candidatus Paceibacterota bacterium]